MAGQCLLFILAYIFLCVAYFVLAGKYNKGSVRFLVLDMLPLLCLLCWAQLQRQIVELRYGSSGGVTSMTNLNHLFFALLLIAIARCVSHFQVVLLTELAWICSLGILIQTRLSWVVANGLGASALLVSGSALFVSLCLGIWLLFITTKEKCMLGKYLQQKHWGYQFQTTISQVLMLVELSLLLALGLAQLLAKPTQNAFLAECAAFLLYMSAVLTDAAQHFCSLSKEAAFNTYYMLIQAALLLEAAVVIC